MGFSLNWRISDRAKWQSRLRALLEMQFDPHYHPVELIVREIRKEKTPDQRRLFHAICGDIAPQLGLTPGQTKQYIKEEFYGIETKIVLGKLRHFVQSTEDSDREEYSRLIDFAYQWAAEAGVVIPDRRPQ